jgi:hypothetical protein
MEWTIIIIIFINLVLRSIRFIPARIMEESRAFWSLLSEIEGEEAARSSQSNGGSWRRSSRYANGFQETLTALQPAAKDLLEQYTDIPEYEMIPHAVRCVSGFH